MVGSFAKAYNLTFDYVLYNMSYANVRMYFEVLPVYNSKDKKDKKKKSGMGFGGLLSTLKGTG